MRIYQSQKMSRIKVEGNSRLVLFVLGRIPSRSREGGMEGREVWKGGGMVSFFKKWCQFLKLEFIKSEDVNDKNRVY